MDWMARLMGTYFERVLGAPKTKPVMEEIRCRELLTILWPMLDLFRDKMALLDTVGSREEFDDEADRAVLWLVDNDGFEGWRETSLGAWARLRDRLNWAITSVYLEMTQGDPVILRLPRGLDQSGRMQACAIFFLLGEGKQAPPEWRSQPLPGSLAELLATSPPRL